MHFTRHVNAGSISDTAVPVSEAALLIKVSAIAGSAARIEEAVEQIAHLLREASGCLSVEILENQRGAIVAVASSGTPKGFPAADAVSLPLREGEKEIGELRITFPRHLSMRSGSRVLPEFVAEQLSLLMARRRLLRRRAALQAGLEEMQQELATLKALARAKGLLMSTQGWSAAVAEHWLNLQSRKTGTPLRIIADRVIANDQGQVNAGPVTRDLASHSRRKTA